MTLGPGLEIVAAENPQPREAFPYNVKFTGQTPVRGGSGEGAAATTPTGSMEVERNVDPTARAAPSTTATTATATTRAAIRIIAVPRTPRPHFTTWSVPVTVSWFSPQYSAHSIR